MITAIMFEALGEQENIIRCYQTTVLFDMPPELKGMWRDTNSLIVMWTDTSLRGAVLKVLRSIKCPISVLRKVPQLWGDLT